MKVKVTEQELPVSWSAGIENVAYTVCCGNLFRRFCNMFSESSPGHWAVLQLPCCPSKQGNFQKTYYKTFGSSYRPRLYVYRLHNSVVLIEGAESTSASASALRTTHPLCHGSKAAEKRRSFDRTIMVGEWATFPPRRGCVSG